MKKINIFAIALILSGLVLVGAGCSSKLTGGNDLDSLRKENCKLSLEKYKVSMTMEQCIENAKKAEEAMKGIYKSEAEAEKATIEMYKNAIAALKGGSGSSSGTSSWKPSWEDVEPYSEMTTYCNALSARSKSFKTVHGDVVSCAKFFTKGAQVEYDVCLKEGKTEGKTAEWCARELQDDRDYFLRCAQGKQDPVSCFGQ